MGGIDLVISIVRRPDCGLGPWTVARRTPRHTDANGHGGDLTLQYPRAFGRSASTSFIKTQRSSSGARLRIEERHAVNHTQQQSSQQPWLARIGAFARGRLQQSGGLGWHSDTRNALPLLKSFILRSGKRCSQLSTGTTRRTLTFRNNSAGPARFLRKHTPLLNTVWCHLPTSGLHRDIVANDISAVRYLWVADRRTSGHQLR